LGNLFELEDLGAKSLKGVEGPVRTWAALRPSSVESRFEALHAKWPDSACRTGRRTRPTAAAMVEGEGWRRPSCVSELPERLSRSAATKADRGPNAPHGHAKANYGHNPVFRGVQPVA
jgi:hypothetical protein